MAVPDNLYLYFSTHSLANFQFPILPWEEFGFVEPCVHAVLVQAGVKSAHGVTVRVGMAEEYFEGAFVVNGWHNGCTDLKRILRLREVCQL